MHLNSRPALALLAILLLSGLFAAVACRDDDDGDPERIFLGRLAEIERRVIDLRGIEPGEPVTYRFVDSDELSAYLAEILDDEETLQEIAHAQAVYRLLGLIDQDASLRDLYGDLLAAQVLGAYDADTREFVVLRAEGEFGPLEETTYAHEYVHYLQDIRFDLNGLQETAAGNDDFALAITALIEGDATHTQTQYMFRHISAAGLGQILQGAGPSLEATQQTPYVLQRGLEFPYVEGTSFVNQLIARGGSEALDAVFDSLPQSTEQIIRVSKYLEGEAPLEVYLPEDVFGEGWTEVRSNVLGQFFLQIWLESLGSFGQNTQAATWGWGGDRYAVYEDGSDRRAFAAVIAWDEPERDSSEFAHVLSNALDQLKEFERQDGGIPGALVLWDGPGGILGMVRMTDQEHGPSIGIVVAPERAQVVPALAVLAGFPVPTGVILAQRLN